MEQTLGKRIVQNRKRMGLTQDQLAEKLCVTAQAVSKWENDQSCPDISILPKLAGIFGITTDELLGNDTPQQVYQAEIVDEKEEDHKNNHFEFAWNPGRKGSLGFALLILLVGIQLFLSKITAQEISFWNILWPSALLVFGLFGLFSKFSFVSMGSALFGAYFLLERWQLLPFTCGGELIFPAILLVFGVSLLVDALKKPRKGHVSVKHNGIPFDKRKDTYHEDVESFEMDTCFGEATRLVSLPLLRRGDISVSFSDCTVDLSAVEAVSPDCYIDADCSFGELTILVPSRFDVNLTTATTFGEVDIDGHPDAVTVGTVTIDANTNFGEITIRYI